jgi:hypothetical protein
VEFEFQGKPDKDGNYVITKITPTPTLPRQGGGSAKGEAGGKTARKNGGKP